MSLITFEFYYYLKGEEKQTCELLQMCEVRNRRKSRVRMTAQTLSL